MGHDYKVTIKDIDRTKKLAISLAPGGGWAARFHRLGHGPTVILILEQNKEFENVRCDLEAI